MNYRIVFKAAGLVILLLLSSSSVLGAAISPRPSLDEPRFAPQELVQGPLMNVTHDSVKQNAPTILKTGAGEIELAWEQDLPSGRTVQQDIFFTTSTDGVNFEAPINLTLSRNPSRLPFLFNINGVDSSLLFLDLVLPVRDYSLISASRTGGIWSPLTNLTRGMTPSFQDPRGVLATDGSIWVIAQGYMGGTATDLFVQRAGGKWQNLTHNGSVVRYPSIAAGDGGQVYVEWVDHANEYGHAKPGINILKWNGSEWERIPNPSGEYSITWANIVYHDGLLICEWPSGKAPRGIRQRVWDGTAWSPMVTLASGGRITYLHSDVAADGDEYRTWLFSGRAYIQRNTETPLRVSGDMTMVKQVASFLAPDETVYVAFQRNGDIWFTTFQ